MINIIRVWQVPDYWKTYVHEVDQEREMWLNSFYKAPLRLPMPAELEYWWENGITSLSLSLSPCKKHFSFIRMSRLKISFLPLRASLSQTKIYLLSFFF